MGIRKYSDEEVQFILRLRDLGREYKHISCEFAAHFGRPITEEAARHVVRARPSTSLPTAEPRRLQRRRDVEESTPPPSLEEELERNQRILIISDLHIPYQHPDTWDFLGALAEKYKPTRVVCVGDEVDHHAMSFHDSDPDLLSAGDELAAAIEQLRPGYELFPVVDLVDSNHGSMAYRKGRHYGLPRKYIRDYGEVLEAPVGWKWHLDLLLDIPGGNQMYVHHGLSKDVMRVVAQRGVCVVHGHYHTEFRIGYLGNPNHLLWGLQVGCSVNSRSLAFAYDSTNLGRPIVGHGLVLDGLPRLAPMMLNSRGRWTGVLP